MLHHPILFGEFGSNPYSFVTQGDSAARVVSGGAAGAGEVHD